MRLVNRTAIVTGGASGIGKAIAIRFAEEGARVLVADIVDEPLEGGDKTVDLIQAAGGKAEFVRCDVTKAEDHEAVVARARRLDIMVNNAAIRSPKRMHETTDDDWDNVMGVNAKGVFLGCRAAVRQMLRQNRVTMCGAGLSTFLPSTAWCAARVPLSTGLGRLRSST